MKPKLPLYQYPTAVAFVDDNKNFLQAIKLSLGRSINCLTFTDPVKAGDYINNNSRKELSDIELSYQSFSDSEQFVNKTLNVSELKRENDQRFTEISVAVIDYDMPSVDGLTLCQQLKSSNLKRILLTGHIGAEEAVEAFNMGIIDFYINKSDPDLNKKILEAVKQLQNQYFLDITSNIKIRAIDSRRPIFSDEQFYLYLQKLIQQHDITEYYFLTHPSRYVMTKTNGEQAVLLAYSRGELNEQIRVVKEEAGPDWLLESLISGRYLPYFKTQDGYFDGGHFEPDETLYLAEKIEGRDTFFCALIENQTAPVKKVMLPGGSTFH